MIASLMMYQRAELDPALGRFWALIRRHLASRDVSSPMELSQRSREFEVWESPDLLLSQTCGMPFRMRLHTKVALVGTPDYGLENCAPGYYRSALVIRKSDARQNIGEFTDAVFAYNQTFSQSGYAAAYWHLSSSGFWFTKKLHTGAHLASAKAVAEGAADIASLDAVSWRYMQRYDDFARKLRVIEWTDPTPGLPLITAQRALVQSCFEAVDDAIKELSDEDRQDLGLRGMTKIPAPAYLEVPNPPEDV